MQRRRPQFYSWVGKIPWRRERLPTPVFLGFPGGSAGKESACNVGDLGSSLWVGTIPWRRERLSTPVFWPGEFHELYGSWSYKESDTTERLSLHGCSLLNIENSSHDGSGTSLKVTRWKTNTAPGHWVCHEPPSGRKKKHLGAFYESHLLQRPPGQRNLMGIPVGKRSKPQDPG